jgi:hypothetical protein
MRNESFDDAHPLCQRLAKPLRVTDEAGNAPEGVFVRSFPDGDCIVLNLYGQAGVYVIDGVPTPLEEHGVFVGARGFTRAKESLPLTGELSITYHNPNLIRLMYLNGNTEAELVCEDGQTVTLSLRSDAEATLDGEALTERTPDDRLPHAMSRFYTRTAPLTLAKGTHTVGVVGAEYKYLPSVLVSGNFAVSHAPTDLDRLILRERPTRIGIGECFSDYGAVTLEATVTVPAGARLLELKGTTLYTELTLGHAPATACIASPYRFPVSEEHWGKTVSLRITQRSSLGPIFGDTAYYDAQSRDLAWRGTPPTGVTRFGFAEARWIL